MADPVAELRSLKVALGLDPNTARGVAEMYASAVVKDAARVEPLMAVITEVQQIANRHKGNDVSVLVSAHLTRKVW